jgi:hypothetical protein
MKSSQESLIREVSEIEGGEVGIWGYYVAGFQKEGRGYETKNVGSFWGLKKKTVPLLAFLEGIHTCAHIWDF